MKWFQFDYARTKLDTSCCRILFLVVCIATCTLPALGMLSLYKKKTIDVSSFILCSHISALQPACLDNDTLLNHAGGGSGGYLEYVFKNSAKILFDKEVETITYKRVR